MMILFSIFVWSQIDTVLKKSVSKPIEINKYDIQKYFGILIYSTVMQCSNFRMYWNSVVGQQVVINTINLNKFYKIREFLHFNNNLNQKQRSEEGYDPLFNYSNYAQSLKVLVKNSCLFCLKNNS